MRRRRLRLFGNTCALALVAVIANAQRPVQSVDVFLGSAGGGNVFVGATLPFGMVKAGPDIGDKCFCSYLRRGLTAYCAFFQRTLAGWPRDCPLGRPSAAAIVVH